jgi:hypothetical protein
MTEHTLHSLRKNPYFCHSVARRAPRNLSFPAFNHGEIPHFVRNDKIKYFFRSLSSLWDFYSACANPQAE